MQEQDKKSSLSERDCLDFRRALLREIILSGPTKLARPVLGRAVSVTKLTANGELFWHRQKVVFSRQRQAPALVSFFLAVILLVDQVYGAVGNRPFFRFHNADR